MPQPKPFLSFPVSVKTFIVYTNLDLNIDDIFAKDILPITPFVVVKKRRGRKKKVQEEDPNVHIAEGSIIKLQYMKEIKGAILKEKVSKTFFRNSMTVDIIIEDKRLNFKVSRHGKFQITGCKNDLQPEKAVLYFWNYIKDYTALYKFRETDHLRLCFEPVMYNIDFNLGFLVNREKLDVYINTKTPYRSLLELTCGYTGVNIKIPVTTPYSELKIKCKDYMPSGDAKVSHIAYDAFIEKMISEGIDMKDEEKLNTFLVFQSGKVIMSGKAAVFMEDQYNEFWKIINRCEGFIKEETF